MDYNYRDNSNEEKGVTLAQVMQYAVRILQKWWMILICAVVCAVVGFVVAKVTYEPSYSSTMRFAIDNKGENTVAQGQTSSDISAAIALARNYKEIMENSTTLMDLVAEKSGYDISGSEVKNMVRATNAEDQAIIEITITTNNPDLTYALATSYVNTYSTVTEAAFKSTSANLYDKPQMPKKPNSDNSKFLYTFLGFVFGAGILVLAICISIFIKDTLKSADDVSSKLNRKLLGQVSRVKKPDKATKKLLISDRRMGFAFIESFKIVRTKLESIAKRNNYKVFAFTSSYENEGKTTVVTNTALALAQSGKSVLLIDADLRKPSVYASLGISATNEVGLSGVINGEKSLSESIKYFEKFNLFLLITSQPIADSAEVLSSENMEEIIEAVKSEFDYVIIDTPPASVVADASIVAQYVDACVMVVRNDFAPSRRVKRTIDDIEITGTEVVGCIFNDSENNASEGLVNRSKRHRSYGYGYGYGYEYDDSKHEKRRSSNDNN